MPSPTGKEKRDFFISYAGVDERWAEWIAWCLEEAGYTVIVQKWDFRPGGNFILYMDQAAKEAVRTIAVLSPTYIESDFPRSEWAAALAVDPTGKTRSLIPVRVRDCQLDGLLKPVVYVDLIGLGEDAAKKMLLAAVTDARSKPSTAPLFPGTQISLQPRFPGEEGPNRKLAMVLETCLSILRACPNPVPGEVLAEAEQITHEEFVRRSAENVDRCLVSQDHELFSLSSDQLPELAEPVPDVLARALDAMLRYYAKHKHGAKGRDQVRNIAVLTRRCAPSQCGPLTRVFKIVEKGLKGLGDKALVLEVAEISIHACQRQPRGTQEVELEAQALICGVSWVLQRRGQLEDARAAAEKSLHLGEQVSYHLNTAFCCKCLGRLCRIMAEAIVPRRKELISKSLDHLDEAVKRFSALSPPDFGPDSMEVGDCYSLRGRTLLFANRRQDAEDSIRRAMSLIHDQNTKDYSDLMILAGDLYAARKEYEAANQYYDGVVTLDNTEGAERSEILARALLARGRSCAALGRKQAAITDFRRAQEIWSSLNEPDGVALSRWEVIRLNSTLIPEDAGLLEAQAPRVRVIAYDRHEERLTALPSGRARRTAASRQYWEQLFTEAEQQVAIEGPGC